MAVENRINKNLIIFASLVLAVFHLYTASFGILANYFQTSVHWGLVATVIFLIKPIKNKYLKIIDYLFITINWYIVYYLITVQEELVTRAGSYTTQEVILGLLALIIGFEAGRRTIGYILPVITLVFIFYALFGNLFPGMLKTMNFTIERLTPYLYTSSDGLFGQVLNVSAQFIFLFVLFGAVLNITGAGDFFVDISNAIAGKLAGGPAQAAVVSSMLMGTINGSGAANVVTTGTFTIPLMKRVGYKPHFAGAVEAVASNGGQIMPPVMGAVAFLMAELTSISYASIMLAALFPAILYYITLSSSVYFNAKKNNFKGMSANEIPKFFDVLKKGWLYLAPLIILIILLVKGFSPQKAAFFAIVVTFIIGLIKDRKKMTLNHIMNSFQGAAQGIMPIASATFLAGAIMGVIQLTGLGIKISTIIESFAYGNLMIALLLTMITSLILGMGLPTSAAYLILAILVAPALVNMGVSVMAAHLFILYFGALSTITPPVALSVFAASSIAESDVWKTGIESVKLASAGFIIPFIFVYNEVLLLEGTFLNSIIPIITAILGAITIGASFTGWLITNLSLITRIILFFSSIGLFIGSPSYWSLIALVAVSIVLLIEIKRNNKLSALNRNNEATL